MMNKCLCELLVSKCSESSISNASNEGSAFNEMWERSYILESHGSRLGRKLPSGPLTLGLAGPMKLWTLAILDDGRQNQTSQLIF